MCQHLAPNMASLQCGKCTYLNATDCRLCVMCNNTLNGPNETNMMNVIEEQEDEKMITEVNVEEETKDAIELDTNIKIKKIEDSDNVKSVEYNHKSEDNEDGKMDEVW
eukprot:995119_1